MSDLHRPSVPDSIYAPSDDAVSRGETWAGTATTDPWDPAILSLDGGGIRGYSSLLILRALFHEIALWEKRLAEHEGPVPGERLLSEDELLPCHYFDYMYGTSTGGLIATMLGRLRMSVPQCLEIYRSVGESLFGKQRSKIPLTTKYHHKPLEDAVKDIVKTHCRQHDGSCDGNDWYPWSMEIEPVPGVDLDRYLCQSICLTASHNGRIDEAHLMRTYNHQYGNVPNWIVIHNSGADALRIWQVTRATSAAPFYFDALEADVDGKLWIFKDGGIRENNPSAAAYNEFVSLFGAHKDPSVLLSVGTGRPDESQDGFAAVWPGPFGQLKFIKKWAEKLAVLRNVLIKYTAGEEKHREMIVVARGEHRWYKRLNVSTGLESLRLDDWRTGEWRDPRTGLNQKIPGGATLTYMEETTQAYLDREIDRRFDTYAPPRLMLEQTAEKLVRQRRARAFEAAKTTDENVKRRWLAYTGHYMKGKFQEGEDLPILHQLNPPVAS